MVAIAGRFGLRPDRMVGGGPYNGSVQEILVTSSSTRMVVGDPVIATTTGVTRAVTPASDIYTGVCMGFRQFNTGALPFAVPFTQSFEASATNVFALVVTDPNVEFIIQTVGTGANLAATNVNKLADITAVVPVGNRSDIGLDATTVNTTNTLGWRIVGLEERFDNNWGDTVVNVRVRCNRHRNVNQVAGV